MHKAKTDKTDKSAITVKNFSSIINRRPIKSIDKLSNII